MSLTVEIDGGPFDGQKYSILEQPSPTSIILEVPLHFQWCNPVMDALDATPVHATFTVQETTERGSVTLTSFGATIDGGEFADASKNGCIGALSIVRLDLSGGVPCLPFQQSGPT